MEPGKSEPRENRRKKTRNLHLYIIILILLLIIILLLLLRACGTTDSPPDGSADREKSFMEEILDPFGSFFVSDKQTGEITTTVTEPTEIPTITFAGQGTCDVSAEQPYIELENPEINFVDMVFTLTDKDTGELIARTDKVAPGKFAYVDLHTYYEEPGTYTVSVLISTYHTESGAAMNGMQQETVVYSH